MGSDDAQHRRYNRYYARFEQPDPADSSYDLADPQSLNRYSYTQNDPVNFIDPSGLNLASAEYGAQGCYVDGFFTDCRTALALVNAGAGLVQGGAGFYLDGSVLITEQQTGGENSRTSQRAYWLDLPLGGFGEDAGGGQDMRSIKEVTDCVKLASEVHRLALENSNENDFVKALWDRFHVANSEFRSTGFRSQFRDDTPPGNSWNQPRHYIAGLVAAYFAG